MCKVKQLNGDAPRANNYCTAREYEVFTIIAKNEELKVGDLIDGEKLSNKTVGNILILCALHTLWLTRPLLDVTCEHIWKD